MNAQTISDSTTALRVIETYEVMPDVAVLGCLADGVTVYKQQVRALNLATALVQRAVSSGKSVGRVAVIGGGIAGLTFVSALRVLADAACEITLFEKRWDLCPLQQGADTRWLHPRIYDWPVAGSRNPAAGLPILNWSAGRASDVARTILTRFSDYCHYVDCQGGPSLELFFGLNHLRVDPHSMSLEWMGYKGNRQGGHFNIGDPSGDTARFDTIVAATGFGLERASHELLSSSQSYWRNDMLGQPALVGARKLYVVSGHGDGGIVDLSRIVVERFRQDTILEEIFGRSLEDTEDLLRQVTEDRGGRVPINVKTALDGANSTLKDRIGEGITNLRRRLRKDARVLLHVQPDDSGRQSIDALFENRSSFLNRSLLYMLYKAGAFAIRFGDLKNVVSENGEAVANVVCRHGTRKRDDLLEIFSDRNAMSKRLAALEERDDQLTQMLWPLGIFPHVEKALL